MGSELPVVEHRARHRLAGGGFWGLFWVGFVSIAAFFALALLLARLAGARAFPTLVGFAPVLMFGFSAFTPRATMIVQSLLFLAVLFVWWWGGRAGRTGMFTSIAVVGGAGFALSLLGNWLHLSFMLMSAAIAVMWAIGWWASPGVRGTRWLSLTAAGTTGLLLGCVASPFGIPLTLERARVVAEACRGLISEWQSIVDLLGVQGFRFVPFTVVVVVLAIVAPLWVIHVLRTSGRFDPRVRIIVPLAAIGVPALVAGLDTLRFTLVGMLLLLPVFAGAATSLINALHRRQARGVGLLSRPKAMEYTSGRFWTVILTGLMILVTPLVAINVAQGATTPEASVISALPRECRLWATHTVGSSTILLRPDVKVWFDGRADFYGRDHLIAYLTTLTPEGQLPEGTDCVVLSSEPIDQWLANSLDERPGWSRVDSEAGYTLWVRE
ncbi:hypothetical protein ACFFRL_19555 [Agromyces hippuratus]|uniref:hypothetical protein n=1 Tax=Agromyces hippuratus TaxID=286438 RepID=UPI0035EFC6D5